MYYCLACIKYRAGDLRQVAHDHAFAQRTGPWFTGQPLTVEVPQPLEFELDPMVPGEMPVFFSSAQIPLMREDFLQKLVELGVDNIDAYDAIVRDPETGQLWTDYKAVNIIGLISATDLGKSAYVPTDTPIIDVLFDTMVIDETRTGGALLFRLAENLNAILAHGRLRDALRPERLRFPHLTWIKPEEWAG